MRRFNAHTNNRGAVAPLVAIMLIVILVCVALVVDLGHIHNVKVQMQRAVDAAALAGAHELTDDVAALAAATEVARTNLVDNETIGDEVDAGRFTVTIDFGLWDDTDAALGQPASVRYNSVNVPPSETPNAVRVTATRNVDHIFFWFLDDTEVVTDAIAVMDEEPLTLPIAVVSCIPTGADDVLTPGQDICDLSLLKFQGGPDDNAGWSGLTIYPANQQAANIFMNEDTRSCGIQLFNEVVYGTDSADGLETAPIQRGGCPQSDTGTHFRDIDTSTCTGLNPISCGLGGDFVDQDPDDPLLFTTLPRWNNFDSILDISTMKGLMSRDTSAESFDEYEERLALLKMASDPTFTYTYGQYDARYGAIGKQVPSNAMKDERFDRYITTTGSYSLGPDGMSTDAEGTANFDLPIEEAGYPVIDVTNGVSNIIDLVKELTVPDGEESFNPDLRDEYAPFDGTATYGRGMTVVLTIPIIWSRECENRFIDGFYVGTANLLLTRLWKSTQMSRSYDNADDSIQVSGGFDNESTCSFRFEAGDVTFFGPREQNSVLPNLTSNQLRRTNGFATKSMEGLLLEPTLGEDAKIIRKIYLVE